MKKWSEVNEKQMKPDSEAYSIMIIMDFKMSKSLNNTIDF